MTHCIGLDIGRAAVHVCTADPSTPAKSWPVDVIDLTKPDWYQRLIIAVPVGSVVTFEPTGWNYSAPITRALTARHLLQVEHSTTKAIRQTRISAHKTDAIDARTLALIALDTFNGEPPRRVKHHDARAIEPQTALRLAVNARVRAVKETTRTTNRLKQLAHAVNPFFAQRLDTYRHAISAGAVTPDEIAGAPFLDMHGNRRAAIRRLADQPPVTLPAALRAAILTTAAELDAAEAREADAHAALLDALDAYPSPAADRWMTVPAASPLYVAAILVAVGDPCAVDVDTFKAALGAYPQLEHSGTTARGRSTKKGYRPAMNALHLWTLSLLSADSAPANPVREYFAGGEKAGGRKMTAAKAKLARILWAVARSEEGYKYEERA